MAILEGTQEEKLNQARDLFRESYRVRRPMLERMKQDFEFTAGTQWDDNTIKLLAKEGRPALTFNQIAPAIRELIGANEDARRRARVGPVGDEDSEVATILDSITQRLYSSVGVPKKERNVLERSLISGVGYVMVDVDTDPNNLDEYVISIEEPSTLEVIPDPAAVSNDLSDARFFFWNRWISEAEFLLEYPDKADRLQAIKDMHFGTGLPMVDAIEQMHQLSELDLDVFRDPMFFDSNERLIRLIRLFYESAVKRYYVYEDRVEEDGHPVGWVQVDKNVYDLTERLETTKTRVAWDKEYRWFEFTGIEVLFDGVQPIPINRLAIIPLVAFWDWVQHEPYGIVKDLKDPQREINKRYSQELDMVNKQVQPGVFAETDAVDDQDDFEKKVRQAGSTAFVKSLAQIRERTPPQVPVAAQALSERADKNFQRSLGFALDPLLGERGQTEPVGTALLRHRRSIQAITPLIKNFRDFQTAAIRSLVEIMVRMLPDKQLQRMLGNPEMYVVQEGVVHNRQTGAQIPIRSIRNLQWNVEMESVEDDTTGQLLLLQTLVQITQAGLAVDPEIIVEFLPISREKKARQREYIQQVQTAQSQQAQMQTQIQMQEVQQVLDIERNKTAQREIADKRRAEVTREGHIFDLTAKVMDALLNVRDAEKKNALALLQTVIDASKNAERQVSNGEDKSEERQSAT